MTMLIQFKFLAQREGIAMIHYSFANTLVRVFYGGHEDWQKISIEIELDDKVLEPQGDYAQKEAYIKSAVLEAVQLYQSLAPVQNLKFWASVPFPYIHNLPIINN